MAPIIRTSDPLAVAASTAIRTGQVDRLRALLAAHSELATARLGDGDVNRTLLHVATDWPGHYPNVGGTVTALVEAGADVNARFRGAHLETPLHWAASSGDIDAVVALIDHGADVEARGGVINDGTPLRDATAFGCWQAAEALIARGAVADGFDLAALGMTSELLALLPAAQPARRDEIDQAFWSACHGNQVATARELVSLGADIDTVPGWENATPLDIAARSGAHDVLRYLHGLGARTFEQSRGSDE